MEATKKQTEITAASGPTVVLFEDRPKQLMVYEMNMSVYIDANVVVLKNIKELKARLKKMEPVDLVVARATYKGEDLPKAVFDLFSESGCHVPIIAMGEAEATHKGITYVERTDQVKPLLQNAAKLLGITAQQMASKVKAEYHEIKANFLTFLFTAPSDVYVPDGEGFKFLMAENDPIARGTVAALAKKKGKLFVKSLRRLRFANAFTEQVLRATEDLQSATVTTEKKMNILAASVEIVAAQFQSSGMDAEIVELAQASIKAIENLADTTTNVGNLVKQLMSSEGGYRYAHSQLITYLGFHMIKMMNWWGSDQRDILSQAAFYHDICLTSDAQAKIHSLQQLKTSGITDRAEVELILTHSQLAAREMQNAPDMNPEVIRLVLQHHGTKAGKAFSSDISELDKLVKVFMVAEEWADYLISLADDNAKPQNEAKMAELKAKYNDSLAQQLIETLRYLDPEKFSHDLLEEEILIAADVAEPEVVRVVKGGDAAEAEMETLVKGVAGEPEGETRVKSGAGGKAEEETIVKGDVSAKAEEKTKVKGATGKAESETRVKGGSAGKAEVETIVKGGAAKKAESETQVKGGDTPSAKGDVALKAEGPEPKTKSKGVPQKEAKASPEGEKDAQKKIKASVRSGAEDSAKGKGPGSDSPAAPEEARIAADGEPAAEGDTRVAAADAPSDRNVTVAGEAVVQTSTKVSSVTYVRNDAKINVSGEGPAAEKSSKIEGVTEHIKEETFVIKGEENKGAASYVQRSLQSSPEEKQAGELKMKQLSGTTPFMTMVLKGELDKVEALAKEPTFGVEMKKTDAEGRTALHYAAMSGSVPMLTFLLSKGAQKSAVDSKRRSALYLAALYKKNEAFDFLLSQGCQAKQQAMGGMTIAMVAAFSGNLHILKEAVNAGVRLDTADHTGKKALDYAKQSKAAEVIQFIEAGGRV